MADIRYLAPQSLDEAIGAFAAAGSAARILAGGTDLLVQMRSGMAAVASAIYNALGVRFYSLPMSPPKVSEALDAPAE